MRRKLFTLLTVSVMTIAILTGCAKENSEISEAASVASSEEEKELTPADMKVGVCIHKFSDTYMSLFKNELEKDLIEAGFNKDNIKIVNSAVSHGYEMLQIRKLIEEGVDILIVNPVNTSMAGEVTDLAIEAGIPLIYVNREPLAAEELRWEKNNWKVTYIGCDARHAGIIQGKIITDLGMDVVDKNGDGVVQYIMIEGERNNTDAFFRTKFSVSTLEKAGWRVACLADSYGNWDKNIAEYAVNKALEEHPNAEVIFCNNDSMALGALVAVDNAGLIPGEDLYIVGADAFESALEEILNGKIAGTVFNDYVQQARLTTGAVLSYMKKQNVEHYYGCDYVKVTKENAESILDIVRDDSEDEEENAESSAN